MPKLPHFIVWATVLPQDIAIRMLIVNKNFTARRGLGFSTVDASGRATAAWRRQLTPPVR